MAGKAEGPAADNRAADAAPAACGAPARSHARRSHMIPSRNAAVVAAAALAATALGCAAKSNLDQLPGAVYAARAVHVYRSAVLTNLMGNETWGDGPDSYMQGQTWYFNVRDSKATVLKFYEKELAGAERTTNDDGSISFKVIPAGAEKDEFVTVTVDEGEIRIGEHCRPGKIKS
jgi:hypothetical protein